MAEPQTATDLDALIADAKLHAARVGKLNLNDNQKREFGQKEIANNVWPWLVDFAVSTKAALDELGADVDDLMETEGSVIQPELAAMIFTHLELEKQLFTKLRAATSDVGRKEIEKLVLLLTESNSRIEVAVSEAAVEIEPGDEEVGDVVNDAVNDAEGDGPDDEEEEDDDNEDTAPGADDGVA